MNRSVWRNVIQSIENAIPLYEEVNETISLGRASRARSYAAERLIGNHQGRQLILDSGVGPGDMSRVVLERGLHTDLVGLDYSTKLLHACKKQLLAHRGRIQFVRACFEQHPFRASVFDAAVTAFALRDSVDLERAIGEYATSIKREGRLVVVDLGKPDSPLKRFFAVLYVKHIMPIIAGYRISGRLKGNPWRTITPTYTNLPSISKMVRMFEEKFRVIEKREFLAGGILVITLQSATNDDAQHDFLLFSSLLEENLVNSGYRRKWYSAEETLG